MLWKTVSLNPSESSKTHSWGKKKISRPHEKSSWCEGFWLHSLTAAVNNRDQYKKISADAHMQLDAEQHQEKKGNFK